MKIEETDEAVICSTEGLIDQNGRAVTLSIQMAKDCSFVKLESSTGEFAELHTDRFALECFANILNLLLKKGTNKPGVTLHLSDDEFIAIRDAIIHYDSINGINHEVIARLCEKLKYVKKL